MGLSTDIYIFLRGLCQSEDLTTQLLYLRTLDEDTRIFFYDTVFENEILIACAHVHSVYGMGRMCIQKGFSDGAATMLYYYFKCVTKY